MILEALKRLEYRGYDSAGIATLVDGAIERRRSPGKLSKLGAELHKHPLSGRTGIGHTRWATHGAPTTINAHPHANARVAIVHNGIIENFRDLRAELIAKGHKFESETDSEVAVHLIADYLTGSFARRGRQDRGPAPSDWGLFAGDDFSRRRIAAHRRTQGQPTRGRVWRTRSLSWLRRVRACALHQPRCLHGGWRCRGGARQPGFDLR